MEIEELFGKIRLRYMWMFITEKCNLDCDYCFYKFRDLETSSKYEDLINLIKRIPSFEGTDFVISGGEPLLEWELVKKLVRYVRENFKENNITIQTNGMLINEERASFFKENNVVIEFGIDGSLVTTAKHRTGTNEKTYQLVLNSIKLAREKGVMCMSTMVVHPKESKDILNNFLNLLSLGLELVEITPATFEKWEDEDVKTYKENYLKTLEYALKNNKIKNTSILYDLPIKYPAMDIISQPNGEVLPNWCCLSFPREVKRNYRYMEFGKNGIKINEDRLKFYLQKYKDFFNKKDMTYREFSTLHSELVYKELEKQRGNLNFDNYAKVCNVMKEANQKFVRLMGDPYS